MVTFGYTASDGASAATIENIISGGLFQMGANDGTGDSITARIYVSNTAKKIKCCLYDDTKTPVLNGVTEEILTLQAAGDKTFNFIAPKPLLTALANYYIVVWSESASGSSHFYRTVVGGKNNYYDAEVYNGFPNPLVTSIYAGRQPNIFCTYTEGVPPPPAAKKKIPNYFNSDFVPCDS